MTRAEWTPRSLSAGIAAYGAIKNTSQSKTNAIRFIRNPLARRRYSFKQQLFYRRKRRIDESFPRLPFWNHLIVGEQTDHLGQARCVDRSFAAKGIILGNHEFIGARRGRFIDLQALHDDLNDCLLVGRVVQPAHRLSERPRESGEQWPVLRQRFTRREEGRVKEAFDLVRIIEQ